MKSKKAKTKVVGINYSFSVIIDDKKKYGSIVVKNLRELKSYLKTTFLRKAKGKIVKLNTLEYVIVFKIKEVVPDTFQGEKAKLLI